MSVSYSDPTAPPGPACDARPYGAPDGHARPGRLACSAPVPAEHLFRLLPLPAIVRRFSDHPPMGFVEVACAYALEEDFA